MTDRPTTDEIDPNDNILEEAWRKVLGDRIRDYGGIAPSFQRAARLWSALFGFDVQPSQVVRAMILLKLARDVTGRHIRDTSIDIAGYAQCLEVVCNGER